MIRLTIRYPLQYYEIRWKFAGPEPADPIAIYPVLYVTVARARDVGSEATKTGIFIHNLHSLSETLKMNIAFIKMN